MSYSELSDEQLVVIVCEKDKEAYSEIVRRYQAKLAHYLRKFINHSAELEDVLQDVFIKAYRNLYSFDVKQKFSSWIFRVAHNEAINNIKKRKNERLVLDEYEWELMDEKIDLSREVDQTIARERIIVALGKTKERYREPIILFFFEEKSYEEISDILKIPTSTVGTLILRGKEKLRELLKKT
jgi:RNA polymerase sigma-70 factor (ECF subfamily)